LTSKKFHEKCESGAMPLALLEKKIDAWLKLTTSY
jgi:uncharacterized protein (DUF885 family)